MTVLALALLATQSLQAQSYPLAIQYGRSWPLSVVVDGQRGLVYVDATSGIYPPTGFSFGVVNVTSHALLRVLPLDVTPGAMVQDGWNGDVYVAGNDSIDVFDPGAQAFVGRMLLGRPILFMADGYPVSHDLFFTSGGAVYAVDPTSGREVANATVGGEAGSIAVDPVSGMLYVGNYVLRTIFILPPSLNTTGTLSVPRCCPSELALAQSTQMLYASTGTNFVEVVDARSDSVVKETQVAPSGQNSTSVIVADQTTGRVFVSSSPGGSIIELNSQGAVGRTFIVTSAPAGLAVDNATGELFATNYHQITVFDARAPLPGPNYTAAELALSGAAVAAVALVVVLRWTRQGAVEKRGGQDSGPATRRSGLFLCSHLWGRRGTE